MNNFLFIILCSLLENISTIFIWIKLKNNMCIKRYVYCACIIISIISGVLEYYQGLGFGFSILITIMLLLVIVELFHTNLIDALVIHSFDTIIVYLIQEPISVIMHWANIDMLSRSASIIGNLSTLLIVYIVVKTLPIDKLYMLTKERQALKICVINTYLIVSFLFMYFHLNLKSYYSNLALIAIIFFVIIFINYYGIYSELLIEKKQHELDNYKSYMPIMNDFIDYIRTRQHDFDNELQTISALSYTHKDYESLSKALSSYSLYLNRERDKIDMLKLNMPVLASLLFSKLCEAEHKGISIKYNIYNYMVSSAMPEYNLLDVLGILIDNAIRETPSGEKIYIDIDSKNNVFLFSIYNLGKTLTHKQLINMFKKGYTTKHDTNSVHGIGLYKLKKLINEYNGEVVVSNKTIDNKSYICFEIKV